MGWVLMTLRCLACIIENEKMERWGRKSFGETKAEFWTCRGWGVNAVFSCDSGSQEKDQDVM